VPNASDDAFCVPSFISVHPLGQPKLLKKCRRAQARDEACLKRQRAIPPCVPAVSGLGEIQKRRIMKLCVTYGCENLNSTARTK
jgi:hypothetical protein